MIVGEHHFVKSNFTVSVTSADDSVQIYAEGHHVIIDCALDMPVRSLKPTTNTASLTILEHPQPGFCSRVRALYPMALKLSLLTRLHEILKAVFQGHGPQPDPLPPFWLKLIPLPKVGFNLLAHAHEADGFVSSSRSFDHENFHHPTCGAFESARKYPGFLLHLAKIEYSLPSPLLSSDVKNVNVECRRSENDGHPTPESRFTSVVHVVRMVFKMHLVSRIVE